MATIQVNGTGFDGSNGSTPVDRLEIDFLDALNGVAVETLSAYDPLGPNAGSTDPDFTILTWTPVEITVDYDAGPARWVGSVRAYDATDSYNVAFDVDPDQSLSSVNVTSFEFTTDTTLVITGTGFDPVDSVRMIGTMDATVYDPAGPNSGFNGPGFTMSVTGTQIEIEWDAFPAFARTSINTVDFHDVVPFNVIHTESPVGLIVPLDFTSYTSPAVDTLRLEAAGGLFSGGAVRLLMSFSNGTLIASNPDDPNEAATNLGNGITVITWTDTVVEIQSPFIPTGTAVAVAVQADLAVTIDEWENDSIDLIDGFPAFNAL